MSELDDAYPTDAIHRLKTAGVRAGHVRISVADRSLLVTYIETLESWFGISRAALDLVAVPVICLCCGNYYNGGEGCPNQELLPHSLERALAVAERLHGIDQPSQSEILAALDALDGDRA